MDAIGQFSSMGGENIFVYTGHDLGGLFLGVGTFFTFETVYSK